MPKVLFTKPQKTFAEQLQLLKDRGLIIKSDEKALHLLERLNYFRLSGYWYPLLDEDKSLHVFKKGAKLETAFKIYQFDRDLRALILRELEKIEVAIRSQMVYVLSHQHSPFWFRDNTIYKKDFDLDKSLEILHNEFNKSDEKYIRNFKDKYMNSFPPSWMALEITSFGTLSMLFTGLRSGSAPKKEIAKFFGLDDKTFSSWLHCFVYLRNICAHHGRLWNREMQIAPKIPATPKKQWLNNTAVPNNRSYFILSMLLYLLQTVHPNHRLIFRLKILLAKYQNIDVSAMGFPEGWKEEPLWQAEANPMQWAKLTYNRIRYKRFFPEYVS